MEWFGYARTGRNIVVGDLSIPEWELDDPAQQAIAQANPYGYLANLNSVRGVTWSTAKRLYQ
jgi:hypothetical protein